MRHVVLSGVTARVVAIAIAIGGRASGARAEGGTTEVRLPPEKVQPVQPTRFSSAPVIDGQLDDAAWSAAVVLSDFRQTRPGDNTPPSQPTRVLLGYDDKALYLAFIADDDPGKVRATLAPRDAIYDDDYVGLYLDTFHDKRRAYKLFFNPFGIQADAVVTEGVGEDTSIDVVMSSKGRMTETGYAVEIAIPFKSLRYHAGPGRMWGVHFVRSIQRLNGELDSWMPLSRDHASLLAQAGTLAGLDGIARERTLEVIPTMVLTQRGQRTPDRFATDAVVYSPGLTAKVGLTSTATLEGTLNPDFADVEADQPVVTENQRFPIFFDEKRPFFLEGRDYFQTPLLPVHTRAIVDPDFALKLTGKRGRDTFGALVASDNAPGSFDEEGQRDPANAHLVGRNAAMGVVRLLRDVGRESSVGMIATHYDFFERRGQVAGLDTRVRLDARRAFSVEVLGTRATRRFFDPEQGQSLLRTGSGFGYAWSYDQAGRHLGFSLRGEGRTGDYTADLGFTRRTNTNLTHLTVKYNSEPRPESRLISWHLSTHASAHYDWQGRMQAWNGIAEAALYATRQTYLTLSMELGYERLFEEEFGARRTATHPGTFFGGPERSASKTNVYLSGETTPSDALWLSFYVGRASGVFDLDYGAGPRYPRVSPAALQDPEAPIDPGPGRSWDATASITYRPIAALNASLSWTKSRLVRHDTGRTAFDDTILSCRTTYQFTRFSFARVRVDYDSLASAISGQYLLGWTPMPGTSVYLGYDDDLRHDALNPFTGHLEPGLRRNARTLFVKVSYALRRSFTR